MRQARELGELLATARMDGSLRARLHRLKKALRKRKKDLEVTS